MRTNGRGSREGVERDGQWRSQTHGMEKTTAGNRRLENLEVGKEARADGLSRPWRVGLSGVDAEDASRRGVGRYKVGGAGGNVLVV